MEPRAHYAHIIIEAKLNRPSLMVFSFKATRKQHPFKNINLLNLHGIYCEQVSLYSLCERSAYVK